MRGGRFAPSRQRQPCETPDPTEQRRTRPPFERPAHFIDTALQGVEIPAILRLKQAQGGDALHDSPREVNVCDVVHVEIHDEDAAVRPDSQEPSWINL